MSSCFIKPLFSMSKKCPKLTTPPSTPITHHFHNLNNNNFQSASRFFIRDSSPGLIPGLPDHITQICLSKLPPSLLFYVSQSWRNFIYSPLFPPFLSLYAILTPIHQNPNPNNHDFPPISIRVSNYDPIMAQWQWVPPPPDPPLDLLIRHPSFISRNLPVQSVTVANRVAVVAATSRNFLPALNRPLVFDPVGSSWGFGPEVQVPRRWCAAGSVGGTVYVAGGVGAHFSRDTSRLVEKWDLAGAWEKVTPLNDDRFSREAVDAVGWKGKLCMVNIDAKEGAVYDTRREECGEMPAGMVAGWTGPAGAMSEEEVYLVDRSKGVLKKYDEEKDSWADVFECERLRGAQQIAAASGKVCVVSAAGSEIIVVDVVPVPVLGRMWVVEPPPGFNVMAVHILPRMSPSQNNASL